MKNLTWQNPEQLFVAQELINKVKSKCCGIKVDLGEVKTVTTVSIEYYDWYYGVKSYQSIRTSPDGVKWTDWKEIPDRSSVGTHYLTFSYPAETRYIELVLGDYAYSSHYGTYMCNIFVYAK